MPPHRPIARYLVATLVMLMFSGQSNALTIVTSIKPVELLVRAIATDNMEIQSLVPAGSSPHTYQLRPSDRRSLADAAAVFWIGPNMEAFLAPLFASTELASRSHALEPDDDSADSSAKTINASGHSHEHEDGHNPHIWLDPEQARAMVRRIHQTLVTLPGTDRQQLDRNLADFEAKLTQQEARLKEQLKPARHLALFTYHDAFRLYADFYGLTIGGVLSPSPDRSPGARQLADIQQQLRQAESPCVLVEPQFSRQHWAAISEGVSIKRSTWDPLATAIESDPDGYLAFQQTLADAVLACLPEQAQ